MKISRNAKFYDWYGYIGGALAWLLHFLGSYAIAEFSCVSGIYQKFWLGISATSWLLFALTGILFTASVFSAYSSYKRMKGRDKETRFQLDSGVILGTAFSFIILFESVPIFFFLRSCG